MRWWERVTLTPVDARVLRATDPLCERTAARIGQLAGCREDVAASCLRRLRARMLVSPNRYRPARWVRTYEGDVVLEHTP